MSDLISRQAAMDALKMDVGIIPYAKAREYAQAVLEEVRNRLTALPSAEPDNEDLIETIKNGITVSNGDGAYFSGFRNGMRWVLSLIDGKEPIYEPSAEPKMGRWIDMDDHVMCSCCGAVHYGVDKNFCPNCGADMRGEA